MVSWFESAILLGGLKHLPWKRTRYLMMENMSKHPNRSGLIQTEAVPWRAAIHASPSPMARAGTAKPAGRISVARLCRSCHGSNPCQGIAHVAMARAHASKTSFREHATSLAARISRFDSWLVSRLPAMELAPARLATRISPGTNRRTGSGC